MAHEYVIGLGAVFDMAAEFGSSRRAALHRYAETHRSAVAGVLLDHSPAQPGALVYRRREVVLSRTFEEQFGPARCWPLILQSPPYTFLAEAGNARTTNGVIRTEVVLPDINNACHELEVEISSNSYNLLVLIWVPRREHGRRRVVVAA